MVIKGEKIDYFKDLLRKSEQGRDEAFEDIPANREQYRGSDRLDGSAERAAMVRNITYELVEAQVSTLIPSPRVDAKVWSEKGARNAESIERLCRDLRNELPFERLNDICERLTYVEGGSVWLIEWDETLCHHGEQGGVRITCGSAEDFFPQPGIYHVEDMEWVILRCRAGLDELESKYGVAVGEAPEEDELFIVYTAFYRNDAGRVSKFVWTGNTVLLDVEDYYARKHEVCERCGKLRTLSGVEEHCVCGGRFLSRSLPFEVLTADLTRSDGSVIRARERSVLKNGEEKDVPTQLPWYRPSRFPVVVRKNTSQEGSVLGQSDCRFIRRQQQEINKVESRIHDKLMSAGCYPVKPEDVDFQYDDTVGVQVLNIPEGKSRNDFGVIDMLPSLVGEQSQSDRLYEHAKRILGISNSFLGQEDHTAASGTAKATQIAQSAGRLDSKRVMKNAAYAEIDRIIFELYLAFADEPRPVAFTDALGRKQNGSFHRYDFLERDAEGNWYYEDRYLFSADSSGAADLSRERIWQMNMESFKAGVFGDPQAAATLLRYWLMQERAHYPSARENVEYFRAMLAEEQARGISSGRVQIVEPS